MKVDRKLFRTRMKKEFKQFIKTNPTYKNVTFSQFVELVKLNIAKLNKETLSESVLASTVTQPAEDLQKMFTQVEEEDEVTIIE